MKKVLIIGGGGFIGSYLAKELSKDGRYEITIVDNFTNKSNIPNDIKEKIYEFRHKELLDKSTIYNQDYLSVRDDLISNLISNKEKFDIVFNLATIPLELPQDKELSRRQIVNDTELNYEIINDLEKYGTKKYIYLSSLFAYGDFEDYCVTEKTFLNPRTPYGISKTIGEYIVRLIDVDDIDRDKIGKIGKIDKINWNIVRTTSVYGFGDLNNRATQIILNKILKNEKFWVNDVYLDFIYIRDFIKGLIKVMESSYVNETFHISGGHAKSINDFVCNVERYYPGLKYDIRVIDDRPKRYTLDNTKARVLLGWEPEYSLSDGIKDYISYIKRFGFA